MTLLVSGPTYHDPAEELLHELEERLNSVIRDVASHASQLEKHEEHVTSRLAQVISDELHRTPIEVDGLRLDVHVEEFNRFQEHRAGADLYISLVRRDYDIPVSKGILVQAKRRTSLLHNDECRRLGNQAKRMYRRSASSYVWVYEIRDVVCAKAPRSSRPTLTRIWNPMTIGALIADGLRCNLGDRDIGRDPSAPITTGIRSVMHRLTVPRGLDFTIKTTD